MPMRETNRDTDGGRNKKIGGFSCVQMFDKLMDHRKEKEGDTKKHGGRQRQAVKRQKRQ